MSWRKRGIELAALIGLGLIAFVAFVGGIVAMLLYLALG